jgi:hypothetical protein
VCTDNDHGVCSCTADPSANPLGLVTLDVGVKTTDIATAAMAAAAAAAAVPLPFNGDIAAAPSPWNSGMSTVVLSNGPGSNNSSGMVTASGLPAECSGTDPTAPCNQMWGMNAIRAPQLWSRLPVVPAATITRKGSHLDNGVYRAHNDIAPQLSEGFTPDGAGDPDADEEFEGHGSHTFGTMAGAWGGGDTRGIAGVTGAAKVVPCLAVSLLSRSSRTRGNLDDIADCLAYAASKDAHWVSSNSWEFTAPYTVSSGVATFLRNAVNTHVCSKGGIFVVAAGNGYCRNVGGQTCNCANPALPWTCSAPLGINIGVDISNVSTYPNGTAAPPGFKHYPAALAEDLPSCVVAVAASNQANELSTFTNHGSAVRLTAPGVNILSDWVGSPWASALSSGTSMSTPHVSGAALLLMNAFPSASAATIVNCLQTTTSRALGPPAYNPTWGLQQAPSAGGLLDVNAAYTCVEAAVGGNTGGPTPSPPPPPPVVPSPPPPPPPATLLCRDVAVTLTQGACSSSSIPPSMLYTSSGDVGSVTASPAGPYTPGATRVTLTSSAGPSCVATVTVTPCQLACRDATVTADAATCTGELPTAFIVPGSLGSNFTGFVITPPGPYRPGASQVTVQAVYGSVVSAGSSCQLTVVKPASATPVVASRNQCLYRSDSSTTQYCFDSAELVLITPSSCDALEATAVDQLWQLQGQCGASAGGRNPGTPPPAGIQTQPPVTTTQPNRNPNGLRTSTGSFSAGSGSTNSGGSTTSVTVGTLAKQQQQRLPPPSTPRQGVTNRPTSRTTWSGRHLLTFRQLLQSTTWPTANTAFTALAMTAAKSTAVKAQPPANTQVAGDVVAPGDAAVARVAGALAAARRTRGQQQVSRSTPAPAYSTMRPAYKEAVPSLKKYTSPDWVNGQQGLYRWQGRWYRWQQDAPTPEANCSTISNDRLERPGTSATPGTSSDQVCVNFGGSAAPLQLVTARVLAEDPVTGAVTPADVRLTVWNAPVGATRPAWIPTFCVDASAAAGGFGEDMSVAGSG